MPTYRGQIEGRVGWKTWEGLERRKENITGKTNVTRVDLIGPIREVKV